jgi:aminocarboxymuconate-semialdehyde decarboxylase
MDDDPMLTPQPSPIEAPMTMDSKCGCGIDVHCHVVPASFPRSLRTPAPASWPDMADAHACHKHVMIDGKVYRTVSDRCWDVDKRIADMNEMGVALQIVSPMPELFSYWMDAHAADDLLRYINDQIAEMVAHSQGRIAGFGAVALQDAELAARELRRMMGDLGFVGVEIGSNVNGRPIGAPEFDPFFALAEELGAAVFVHAVRPAGMDRLVGPPALQQVLGYPTDIGLAAASVITSNLMLRRPNLRIAFSHGGGTLGLLLPRLQQGAQSFPALQQALQATPRQQARKLFYDALVYDEDALRYLTALFGDTQIMLGTDYPFGFHERDPVARVNAAFADEAIREKLIVSNARRFLGLSGVSS